MRTSKPLALLMASFVATFAVFVGAALGQDGDIDLRGTVTAISAESISLDTATGPKTASITSETEIWLDDAETQPGTTNDIHVGDRVHVKAQDVNGGLWAREIELEDDDSTVTPTGTPSGTVTPTGTPDEDDDDDDDNDSHGGEIRVTGVISAFDAGSITVDANGDMTVFAIDENTEIESESEGHHGHSDDDGAPTLHSKGSIDDLALGLMVKVEGEDRNGMLVAEEIEILNDEFEDTVIRGTITDLQAGSVTIDTGSGSRTFEINSNTEVKHENHEDGSLADLAVGQEVVIESEDDSSAVAHEITILDGADKPANDEDEIKGSVSAVDGANNTFDVGVGAARIHVIVGPGTEIKNAEGGDATLADVVVGVFVEVHGSFTDAGLEAREVEIYNEHDESGMVTRVIAGAGSKTLVLRAAPGVRRMIVAGATTRVGRQNGQRASLSSVKAGTAVAIQATRTGKKWVASKIVILTNRRALLRLTGKVINASDTIVRVKVGQRTVRLQIRPGTVVLMKNGRAVSATTLKAGTRVLVVGYRVAGNRFVTMVRVV